MYQYALFTDLDRTLLPNGAAPESPRARPLLAQLAARETLALIYVSGRDLSLLRQAIDQYHIPRPTWAVGDVGSSIYSVERGHWQLYEDWHRQIAPDFQDQPAPELHALFTDLSLLRLQEADRQKRFKLSYYAPLLPDWQTLVSEMRTRLDSAGLRAEVIWSVDEAAATGLIDVLPASATKLHAVEYLMQVMELPFERCVFAGDSGNDLPVVCSGRIQSILVRNAHTEVSAEARQVLAGSGQEHMLYQARGLSPALNGNYSAGIVEGFLHFIPAARDWIELP